MEKPHVPDALDQALTHLYHTDVPTGFSAAWRTAVKREERSRMKQPSHARTVWRVALSTLAALVLVIGALSAGRLIPTVVTDTVYQNQSGQASPKEAPGIATDADESISMSDYGYIPSDSDITLSIMPTQSNGSEEYNSRSAVSGVSDTAVTTDAVTQNSEKIVRTADLTLATAQFDTDTTTLTTLVESMGGYIASVNVNGEVSARMDRVAYYDLRIPSDKLDAFLSGLTGVGHITSRYETATDKSTQYADTELRIKTQREKMSRLQELLGKAADVTELLQIETEIANTQYELDQLESSQRTIDRDVLNSNVSITLCEQSAGDTAQTVELTLWQRLSSGFTASIRGMATFLQNLLVFVAMLMPMLVSLAILGFVIGLIARARRKASRNLKDTQDTPLPQESETHQSDTPNPEP